MPGKGEQPLYRCPKGGLHKFGRRSLTIRIKGFLTGKVVVNARKCTKCGIVWGSGKRLR